MRPRSRQDGTIATLGSTGGGLHRCVAIGGGSPLAFLLFLRYPEGCYRFARLGWPRVCGVEVLDVLLTPAGPVRVTTLLQDESYSFTDFGVNIIFRCGLSTLYRISVRFLMPRRIPVGFRVSSLSVPFPKWARSAFPWAVLFHVFLTVVLVIFIRQEPLGSLAGEHSHLCPGVRFLPAGRGQVPIG